MDSLALRNGSIVHPRVTKHTTHLVIGDEDWARGYRSTKRTRAENYKENGQNIAIMSEAEFRVLALGLSEKEEAPDVVDHVEMIDVWIFRDDGSFILTQERA